MWDVWEENSMDSWIEKFFMLQISIGLNTTAISKPDFLPRINEGKADRS
jgi:hypothetical protein